MLLTFQTQSLKASYFILIALCSFVCLHDSKVDKGWRESILWRKITNQTGICAFVSLFLELLHSCTPTHSFQCMNLWVGFCFLFLWKHKEVDVNHSLYIHFVADEDSMIWKPYIYVMSLVCNACMQKQAYPVHIKYTRYCQSAMSWTGKQDQRHVK